MRRKRVTIAPAGNLTKKRSRLLLGPALELSVRIRDDGPSRAGRARPTQTLYQISGLIARVLRAVAIKLRSGRRTREFTMRSRSG
jgi:hypothetical protein